MVQSKRDKIIMIRIKQGSKGSRLQKSKDILHDINTSDKFKNFRLSTGFKNQNPMQINFIKLKGDEEKIKNLIKSSPKLSRRDVDLEVKVVRAK